jgi:hypothetical protein
MPAFCYAVAGDRVCCLALNGKGTAWLRGGSNNKLLNQQRAEHRISFTAKEADMGQTPKPKPQDVPDSLPKNDTGTDVIPDDVRRTDPSQRVPPDSLPPMEEQQSVERADGGSPQHPIHDDDLDDCEPEDFEREVDAVEEAGGPVR